MKNKFSAFLMVLCLTCCNQNRDNIRNTAENSDLFVINTDKAEKVEYMFLSEICSEIKTIILETKDDILLGWVDIVQVYKDFIFVLDRMNTGLYAYNKEGKFIRKYGGRGGGPGEYLSISDFTIDGENEIVYLLDSEMNQILKYEIVTGKYVDKVLIENNKINFSYIQYNNGRLYGAGDYYRESENGCMVHEINIFTGKSTQCWLDIKQYNKGWNGRIRRMNESFFYVRNQEPFKFVDYFMDTIISFGKDGASPFAVLQDKDWISPKRVSQLKEIIDKEEFEGLSSFLGDFSYNIGGYLEWTDHMLFRYRKKSDYCYVLHNINTNNTKTAKFLIDDIGFNEKIVNHIVCSDADGFYEIIDGWILERVLEQVKEEGYMKKNLDKYEEILNLPEDTNPIIFYYKYK